MKKVSSFVCLFAALLFVASPAMACCFTGEHPSESAIETAATPPCHEMQMLEVADNADDNNDTGICPGCDDCDVVATTPVDLGSSFLKYKSDAQSFIPEVVAYSFRKPTSYIQATGPPPDLFSKPQTPITLKQRLII